MTYTLFYPLFGMFLLTLAVTINMARVRFMAIKSGGVDVQYFKTYEGPAPAAMITASRHFENLFELPVLFYAGVILAIILGMSGAAIHIWTWIFVAARVLHAIIHLGTNKIMWRMRAYALGWVALIATWTLVAMEVCSR